MTSPKPSVALLDYGVGNLHSAAKALDRAGAEVRVVPTVLEAEAAGAAALVVPGVGAYRACLEGLGRAGGPAAVAAWIDARRVPSMTASAPSPARSAASPARSRCRTSAGTR